MKLSRRRMLFTYEEEFEITDKLRNPIFTIFSPKDEQHFESGEWKAALTNFVAQQKNISTSFNSVQFKLRSI